MNAFKSALCAAALAACAMAGAASAAERTTTFEVFLEVGQMCEFTGTTNVDFGTPSPASGNQIDAYGSLTVYCNLPIAYGISLDAGQHGSGTGDRKMASASGATIDYRLYSGSDGDVSCSEASGVQWGLHLFQHLPGKRAGHRNPWRTEPGQPRRRHVQRHRHRHHHLLTGPGPRDA